MSSVRNIFKRRPFSATRVLAYGFLVSILCGALLLMLPVSSAGGTRTAFIDALFTAPDLVLQSGDIAVLLGEVEQIDRLRDRIA